MNERPNSNLLKWSVIGVSSFIVLILAMMFLFPVYSRYQTRQDAANHVKVAPHRNRKGVRRS